MNHWYASCNERRGAFSRDTSCDAPRNIATDFTDDFAATYEGWTMSVREQQVNDALRALDETHRLGQIGRDEYRRCRRQVLESLCDAAACSVTDTVRRVVPAAEATPASTMEHRHDGFRSEIAPSRGRQFGARLATMCVMVLAIVAGAAAACWFLTVG